MNTTQLKSFAAEARKSLLSGVKSKMNALGFKDNGSVDERDYPMQAPDGTLFQGEIYDVSFYGKWMRLKDEISRYGFRQVCEEGAYTWFNRLMAIQILSRNGLIDPVLEFESPDVRIPLMVKQAHEGIRPKMTAFDAARLNAVIDDDNRITDQFAILIVAYCQSTPILYKCFGTLNDFTELQLPTNILASNGFLNLLNGSTFITQDDYETTELIGWLYQFYISERKDEVFASFKSGHKADANDIPAATQIFTPNWIVKYMVQNTLGRIYLDNNPDSTLKDSWQYLFDSPSERGQGGVLQLSSLEDYTFADLSCGSGHILGEAFDMLYAIYIEEGFSRRQAIRAIFEHNLTGVDIDTRAKQLATFSLMLKACQQWPDAINCEVMPRVLDMPQPDDPVCERYPILKQAHNLGSIMKIEPMEGESHPLVRALTERYAAVVMNPPYMGSGNMNAELAKYVKDNYEDYKSDLFAVFMKVAEDRLLPNAKYGMINMQSWMFLSSFEKLRVHVIDDLQIDSMLHLGPRTFDELSGEVVQNTAFVLTNAKPAHAGRYFRLVDYAPTAQKEARFLDALCDLTTAQSRHCGLDPQSPDHNGHTITNNAFTVSQSNFKKIPGCPIGYWITNYSIFDNKNLAQNGFISGGRNKTHDNEKYVRYFWEIASNAQRWRKYANAGGIRKYYGIEWYVVDWSDSAKDFYNSHGGLLNPIYWDKKGITWNLITSSYAGFSIKNEEFVYSSGSPTIYNPQFDFDYYVLGFLNSTVAKVFLKLFNPTINTTAGDVLALPFIKREVGVEKIVKDNISISKQDWDAHETSWDFQENELVRIFKEGKAKDLQAAVSAYKEEWEKKFDQLHDNEEELNRQFIEIYGLQEELTPEVPLEEVTILQQGEISIEDK